jgi:hypothetical protein
VELLTMLVEQTERLEESEAPVKAAPARPAPQEPAVAARRSDDVIRARGKPAARPRVQAPPAKPKARRRNPTFQANPFVVAAAVAITAGSALVAADYYAEDTLTIHRISNSDAPTLDGDTSDRVWRTIAPHVVITNQGDNFDGTGESRIEIRAAHDGNWAYFLFTWDDPTRSLKQLPMVKRADGWHLLHNGYEFGDEHDQRRQVFGAVHDPQRDAGRRPDLPRQSAADRRQARHHVRPRPALHAGPRHLCRRVAVEGHQWRSDRLAG